MVPGDTPVIVPVAVVPAVAILVLALLHVPPPPSVKVAAAPTQVMAVPEIADGSGLIVTTVVVVQPAPRV